MFWEKAMAPHSSTVAWKIPWMEESGRLQSMGSLRVRYDWTTSVSLFTFMHWRKWQPTPVFLPGESQGWGSLVRPAVAQSQIWLKWLSSSSSSRCFTSALPLSPTKHSLISRDNFIHYFTIGHFRNWHKLLEFSIVSLFPFLPPLSFNHGYWLVIH